MKNDREYQICLAIATYLKLKKVFFHFDYAGLHLTKAQAGRMKVIQGGKGWPDLFIPGGKYKGLFLEIKKEGEILYKKDGVTPVNSHIEDQLTMLKKLYLKGYFTDFAIGFDDAKNKIDCYLNLK
jgi:hypothetical protein